MTPNQPPSGGCELKRPFTWLVKGAMHQPPSGGCELKRVMMAVPEGSENECGLNVVELNYGKSDNYPGLSKQRFPFEAELQFDVEIRSGKPVMNLKGIKVVNEPKGDNPLK